MHENHEVAESWNCQPIKDLLAESGVKKCKYLGTGFAQKKGKHLNVQHMCYMTNAEEIVKRMKLIKNVNQIITEKEGEIRRLENFPNQMCRIFIAGLQNQMRADGRLAKEKTS